MNIDRQVERDFLEAFTKREMILEHRVTLLEQLLASLISNAGAGRDTVSFLIAQRERQASTPELREAYRVIIEMFEATAK